MPASDMTAILFATCGASSGVKWPRTCWSRKTRRISISDSKYRTWWIRCRFDGARMTGADFRFDEAAQAASVNRRKGDALKARDRDDEAQIAYETALGYLDDALGAAEAARLDPSDEAE